MNTINNNYAISSKAHLFHNVKRTSVPLSQGKNLFLETIDNKYVRGFVTREVKGNPNGKNAIIDAAQTPYVENGLAPNQITNFAVKMLSSLRNEKVAFKSGEKTLTSFKEIREFLGDVPDS